MLEKLRVLERDHETLRDELQHVRLWLSNSQQEREEEKQSVSKGTDKNEFSQEI